MLLHWTYDSFDPSSDLMQGDLLEPTESLRAVFEQVHRHFLDPKYTAFMILTQSCDLVNRARGCKSRYISIAVIRPITALLHDFLSQVCRPVVAGIYLSETKADAHLLLDRIFNQNEQALGLFYLHKEQQAGINIPSVALLRVSVTLRVEHYEVLKNARRGRLSSEFRNKLGWLVGNMYSRIGTPDWNDSTERKKELKKMVIEQLQDAKWVPRSWVDAATQGGIHIVDLPADKALLLLEQYKPPEPKDIVINHATRIVQEVVPSLGAQDLKRLKTRLNNDPVLAKAIRAAKSEPRDDDILPRLS